MKDMAQDDILSLTGAYVLNALTPEERAAFESKLAGSEQARHEVTELSDTAVLLGLAVNPVEPPASLKLKLMEQIAATPQLDAEQAPVVQVRPVVNVIPGKAEMKAKKRWFQRPLVTGLSAAVAASFVIVAAVAGGVGGGTQTQTNNQADGLASISQSSDAKKINAGFTTGGTATVLWSDKTDTSAVFVHDVAEAPANKTYQLWYINKDGKARSAGLLTSDSVSKGWQVLDGKLKHGDSVGVTIEPEGGSQSPTAQPVMVAQTA